MARTCGVLQFGRLAEERAGRQGFVAAGFAGRQIPKGESLIDEGSGPVAQEPRSGADFVLHQAYGLEVVGEVLANRAPVRETDYSGAETSLDAQGAWRRAAPISAGSALK